MAGGIHAPIILWGMPCFAANSAKVSSPRMASFGVGQPFVSDRLEVVGRRHRRRDPVQLDPLGRAFSSRQQLAGGVASFACIAGPRVRPQAEARVFCLPR